MLSRVEPGNKYPQVKFVGCDCFGAFPGGAVPSSEEPELLGGFHMQIRGLMEPWCYFFKLLKGGGSLGIYQNAFSAKDVDFTQSLLLLVLPVHHTGCHCSVRS